MTIKDALDKIKVMLAEEPMAEVATSEENQSVEINFETYDLKDGSKIDLSALEIGADAMLMDESGNGSPAPSGEYELADGTMVTIVDGKVEGIETPSAEEPTVEEPMAEEKPSEFIEMNATLDYLQAENEALKSKVAELEGKFHEGFANVALALEKLVDVPSAEPVSETKSSFKLHESKDSKVNRYLELVKNLK